MSDLAAKKHLVFHIGDHKTGSTTIQNALAAGKVQIIGKTLLYPAAMAHNYLTEHFAKVAKGEPAGPDRPGMPSIPKLAKRISASDADYIFLSGEQFSGVDQQAFFDIVGEYFMPAVDDFRLVAYVRPHAARVLSELAEQSKIGRSHETLETFHLRLLKLRRFVYTPRFSGWRALYGTRFSLRPMVRDALYQGSILDDFLRTSIGEQPYQVAPMSNANESLCVEDIVLLRLLQAHLYRFKQPMRHAFGWDIALRLADMPRASSRTKFALHRSVAEDIHKAYAEDARMLDEQFFPDQPVMLRELEKSVDTAIATPQSLEPTDYFSADELRTIEMLAGLLTEMLNTTDTKWVQFFRDRRQKAVHLL